MREWRKDVVRVGKPILAATAPDGANFMSIYVYPEIVINLIKANGHTRGLKGQPVYSEVLYIDVDDQSGVLPVTKILDRLGVRYNIYTTGNRGSHFHVKIKPMEGSSVPYSQAQWLKKHKLDQYIDMSIYRTGGQIRAVGAKHAKTGKYKELLEEVEGTEVSVPLLKEPPPSFRPSQVKSEQEELDNYMQNLNYKRDEGGRSTHIFILYKQGLRAGIEERQIWRDIESWNRRNSKPHDKEYLTNKLNNLRQQFKR